MHTDLKVMLKIQSRKKDWESKMDLVEARGRAYTKLFKAFKDLDKPLKRKLIKKKKSRIHVGRMWEY